MPEIIGGGCRNHCPFCLVSKHLDNTPGDRASDCQGLMDPIEIYTSQKGYMIKHLCRKCGEVKNNKASIDSRGVDDSLDKIIEIMQDMIK